MSMARYVEISLYLSGFVLIAAILVTTFFGCSTTPSEPVVITKEVVPVLPPTLMAECPDFELAQSSDLTEILQVHAANMGRANVCRSRHSALVRLLEELAAEDDQ